MIKVEGISKQFKLYRSPGDRLKEILFRKQYHKDFVALHNVSFEIGPGQTLGIIGQNGAGKSTLLKILSGIVIPDSGTIRIDGKVTGLLELGTGFNYEMTGLENIYMNGILLGMPKNEIDLKKKAIIDFSELGEFIHEPIKTYSSGMTMRLAFSIAIHADPTCFLVDEALAIGDAYFQQKCMRKIQEFRASGGSIIFVSHDMNAVKTLCEKTVLLDHGQIIQNAETKVVVDYYINLMVKKMNKGEGDIQIVKKETTAGNKNRFSTGKVKLLTVKFYDENDNEIHCIESEKLIKISFEIESSEDFDDPHYGIFIRNSLGVSLFETNTDLMALKPPKLVKSKKVKIYFEFPIPLTPGNYSVSLGVANKGNGHGVFEEYLLLVHDIDILEITRNQNSIRYGGIFNMKPFVRIQ